MNRILLVTMGLILSTTAASAQNAKPLPTYHVRAMQSEPIIDGILDEPAWTELPVANDFIQQVAGGGRPTPPAQQTRFRIGYTDQALYIAIECLEPNIDALRVAGGTHDPAICTGDSVELFLQPDVADSYIQFMISCAGAHWNGGERRHPYMDQFNPPAMPQVQWQTAATRQLDRYVLEAAIPFDVFGVVPDTGDVWSGNICRNINAGGGRASSTWSQVYSSYHAPEHFGQLIFDDRVLPPTAVAARISDRLEEARIFLTEAQALNDQLTPAKQGQLEWPNRTCLLDETLALDERLASMHDDLAAVEADPTTLDTDHARSLYLAARSLRNDADLLVKRMKLRQLLREAEEMQPVQSVTPQEIPSFVHPDDAEATPPQTQLKLIPTPQRVAMHDGAFQFTNDTALVIANPDDTFAAQQLIDELQTDFAFAPNIKQTPSTEPTILLGCIGRDPLIDTSLREAGIAVPANLGEQGYVLSIKPGRIIVASPGSAGVFYGIQTLKQLMRAGADATTVPCLQIIDWPTLQYRGWQEDVSRGPCPKLDQLKTLVRTLAQFKMNQFTMYTSTTWFKLNAYPGMESEHALTPEKVRELVAYAKPYHVDVIGNFQTSKIHGFGKANLKISEGGYNQVSPVKEEAYDYFQNTLHEIAPAYQSPLFHLNADEFVALGVSESSALAMEIGGGELYAYFISRLARLLEPYGKTPMIWGDILLEFPNSLPELPRNLVVCSWEYGRLPNYDRFVLPFEKEGLRFYVCPGVNCWGRTWPWLDETLPAIAGFVAAGAQHGAIGMLNTVWKDSGLALSGNNWYPHAWAAECAWRPLQSQSAIDATKEFNQRHGQFKSAFDAAFFGLDGHHVANANLLLGQLIANTDFFAEFTPASTKDAAELVRKLAQVNLMLQELQQAKADALHNANMLDYPLYAAQLAQHMLQRRLAITAATDPAQADQAHANLVDLRLRAEQLREQYIDLWNRENHPSNIARPLAGFDALIETLPQQ